MTLTITNILHVVRTKADLYSSSYFKKVQGERKPVNPFTKWVNGRLFAYGVYKDDENQASRVVIDLTEAKEHLTITADSDDPMDEINTCLNKNVATTMFYRVEHPVIPPSKSYIAWKYSCQVKEHQFANWIKDESSKYSGRWETTTEHERQYFKDGKVIEPQLSVITDESVAKELTAYYYINSYDFKTDTLVSIDTFEGASLKTIRDDLQTYFTQRYSQKTVDVKILELDITEADHVDTETEHNTSLMGYWLGKYETYPKMISVDQNENVIATYGNRDEPNMEGDFEYRHSLPDAVFGFKKELVQRTSTLPICNGFCCYPQIVNGQIYALQGQRLSYNKEARDRRWILVDFSPVGGCKFIQLKDVEGSMSELILKDYDSTKQSLLLVVRGRLFLPGEFEVINDQRLLFDLTKFHAIYELDRKLCRGDVVWNTEIIPGSQKVECIRVNHPETNTITVYKPTTDTEFKTGVRYFGRDKEELFEIDTTTCIGKPINKKRYGYSVDGEQKDYIGEPEPEPTWHYIYKKDESGKFDFTETYYVKDKVSGEFRPAEGYDFRLAPSWMKYRSSETDPWQYANTIEELDDLIAFCGGTYPKFYVAMDRVTGEDLFEKTSRIDDYLDQSTWGWETDDLKFKPATAEYFNEDGSFKENGVYFYSYEGVMKNIPAYRAEVPIEYIDQVVYKDEPCDIYRRFKSTDPYIYQVTADEQVVPGKTYYMRGLDGNLREAISPVDFEMEMVSLLYDEPVRDPSKVYYLLKNTTTNEVFFDFSGDEEEADETYLRILDTIFSNKYVFIEADESCFNPDGSFKHLTSNPNVPRLYWESFPTDFFTRREDNPLRDYSIRWMYERVPNTQPLTAGEPTVEKEYYTDIYTIVEKVIYERFSKFMKGNRETWEENVDERISVSESKLNLKNDENSFLIVINKPNLQVVRHTCYEGTSPMAKMPRGVYSFAGTMKNDFDQQARGLLFDESTRSVMDYTRETQTMTFYADKKRRWGISNISTHQQSLIAVMDESSHNLMSARGFVLDDVHSEKYDNVIWPRLSILDFVFRG